MGCTTDVGLLFVVRLVAILGGMVVRGMAEGLSLVAPEKHDWNKLRRLLKYLKGTMYMNLTLSVDNMNTIHWYVDASYGAHMDLKGHTGMMMTLGRGATMSF